MKTKTITSVALFIALLFSGNLNLSASLSTLPEPGDISGKISESSSKKPMEFVTVALYSSGDSSLVTGTITNSDGTFRIEKPDTGKFYLEFSFIGFEKKKTEAFSILSKNDKINLGEIILSPSSSEIKELTFVGEKSRIEYLVDRRVINVDKDLSAQGGTAVEVLENTPSFQVDAQGNLSLRGSSEFTVLIDGKPSPIKGSDALKQIPASAIKQIEIITNPSAKYDADGQTGIINVIMKKERLNGLTGNFNASTSNIHRNTGSGLLNYRQGKLNYFTGLDYTDNIYDTHYDIRNIILNPAGDQYINEITKEFNSNYNLTYKGGIDYDPNEKNSFSVSGKIGKQAFDRGSYANYYLWDNLTTNRYFKSISNTDAPMDIFSVTADYSHRFNEKSTISLSNYFFRLTGNETNTVSENNTDPLFNENSLNSALNYIKDNSDLQYRLNLDYSAPVGEGKFETGAQLRFESKNDELIFHDYDIPTKTWTTNEIYSYSQDYANTIYSGYAIYSDKALRGAFQAGLRSEYFTRTINLTNTDTPFEFHKFMIYPSFHYSKEINERNNFQLSYSRRINRPKPKLLVESPIYIDPHNIFKGNVNLKPEYTDAFEFNYRIIFKPVTLSTQTYFRNTSNPISTSRYLNEEGIMIHQLSNIKNQIACGVEQGIDWKLFTWWKVNASLNIYNYTLKTLHVNSTKTQRVNTWDARLISNFTIKNDTRIQLKGYYRGAGIDAMGATSGFFTTDCSLNHSFMDGKIKAGITALNILNTLVFDYSVKTTSFDNVYRVRIEGPVCLINVSYNFNNFKNIKRGRADDAEFKDSGAF